MNGLKIGEVIEDGNAKLTIVDKDRLCYLVKSESKGAVGLRTLSRDLIKEYVRFLQTHHDATPDDVRNALKGKSDIDKYEYGYTSTLTILAKYLIEKGVGEDSKEGVGLPYQLIFYGAPGTGKSFAIKKYMRKSAVPEDNIFLTPHLSAPPPLSPRSFPLSLATIPVPVAFPFVCKPFCNPLIHSSFEIGLHIAHPFSESLCAS